MDWYGKLPEPQPNVTMDYDLAAQILAADALSRNFEREQDFGEMLAHFLPTVSGDSPFSGFSKYSEFQCNKSRAGIGFCSTFTAREGLCNTASEGALK